MTEPKFNELWTQIGNVATDIVNTCNDGSHFNEKKKEYIRYEYEKLRDECKAKHLGASKLATNEETDIRLDRHKVAACIAGAILSASPIEGPNIRQGSSYKVSYFANETLALFAALGIVKSFIRSDKENVIELDLKTKEVFLKRGFCFPKPTRDDYLHWLLFMLQESTNIGFNVLSFSNILYLLEIHSMSQYKIEELEKKCSKQ